MKIQKQKNVVTVQKSTKRQYEEEMVAETIEKLIFEPKPSHRCSRCLAHIDDPFLLKISGWFYHEDCAICGICELPLANKIRGNYDTDKEENGNDKKSESPIAVTELVIKRNCGVCFERNGILYCKMHYPSSTGELSDKKTSNEHSEPQTQLQQQQQQNSHQTLHHQYEQTQHQNEETLDHQQQKHECAGCRIAISPTDMVYKLKMGIVYHVKCHVCFKCGKQLTPGERIIVYEATKSVSCVSHFSITPPATATTQSQNADENATESNAAGTAVPGEQENCAPAALTTQIKVATTDSADVVCTRDNDATPKAHDLTINASSCVANAISVSTLNVASTREMPINNGHTSIDSPTISSADADPILNSVATIVASPIKQPVLSHEGSTGSTCSELAGCGQLTELATTSLNGGADFFGQNLSSISIPRFVMDQSNDFQQLSQNNSENQFTMISSDYGSPKILSCFASALGDVDTPGGANHPLGDFPRLLPQNTISSHSSLVTGGTLSELGEVDPSILKSENDPTNILSYAAVSAMDTQMDGISPFDAQTNSFCAQLLNASGGSATCGLGTNAGLSNPYLNSVALGTAPDDKLISNYNGSFIPFTLNSLNASGNFADFINISTPFSSAGGIEKLGGMSGLSELSSFISPFPPFLGTPELSAGGMNSMMMMSDATLHCQNTTTNAGIGMLNQYDNYEHETLLRDFMSAKGCAMPNGLPAAASLASINNQQQSSANISSFMSQSIMSTNEQKTYHRQRNNAATSSSYDGLIGISDQESNSTSLKATDKNASRLRTSNAYSPLTSTASATAYGARSRAAGKRVTKQQKATAAAASDDVGIDKVLKDRLKKFGIFRSSSPPIAELNHSIVGTISANNHKDSAVNLARQEQHHHHHQQQQQQMAQFQVSQQQQQQQFRQQLQQQQKQQQHLATSSAAFYNSNPLSTSSRIPISSTTSVAEVLASVGSLNAKSRASATIAGDQTPMNVISGSAPATKYPFEMYVFGEMYAAEADAAKFLKRRGPRTSIKQEQLDLLNEIFATTPKPSKHARAKLAVQTGLSMRVIQVWFQNRRSKERRLKHLCNFLRHCERLDGAGEAKKFASCGDENFFTSLEAADFAEFLELKFRENFMDYEAASAAYSDSVVSDYNNPSSTIKNTNYIEKLECAYDVGAFPGKAPKNVMSGIIHSDKSGNVSDDNDDDGIEDKEDEDEFDNDTITVNTMPF